MLRLSPPSQSNPPAVLSYGIALLSVVAALIIAWWIEAVWRSAPHASVFLCAVMFSVWFGGIKPGLVATALSLLTFSYFFLPAVYSGRRSCVRGAVRCHHVPPSDPYVGGRRPDRSLPRPVDAPPNSLHERAVTD
jgi:hypothetical protein